MKYDIRGELNSHVPILLNVLLDFSRVWTASHRVSERPYARHISGRPHLWRVFALHWVLLVIADLLEIAWATGLKSSEGFTPLWPSLFTVVTALGTFWLLGVALRHLPLGTA
ncbi:Small Multidrug Resistance (SMR) protein [Paraburkholderia sp. BL21I4N1]|nr:Small Multidrug Resistance (SMR) protein [Paraburkholderia sp. BL21I4N1]